MVGEILAIIIILIGGKRLLRWLHKDGFIVSESMKLGASYLVHRWSVMRTSSSSSRCSRCMICLWKLNFSWRKSFLVTMDKLPTKLVLMRFWPVTTADTVESRLPCASKICSVFVQGFHLLQNVKSWQSYCERRPVVDTRCREVVQQCCWAVFEPQQGCDSLSWLVMQCEMKM